MPDINITIALLSLSAFAIFVVWQFLKRHEQDYPLDPTEAGKQFMEEDLESRARRGM